MKMVKSLVLGSAAALVAMGGAQAADLPVKAKAVEYVRICSLYGAGFWYIPGTDTCIKIGGYLRVDVQVNSNSDDSGNMSGQSGAMNRFVNAYMWRSREDLNIDTRTATEYGVLRTFWDATFNWTSDPYIPGGNGGSAYGSALGVGSNAINGAVAGGSFGNYLAFIQFAGFTIGKAISNFSMNWTNYPGNNFDGLVGGGGTVTGVNQFTYTAQFGNGVSASIGVQDQVAYYQAGVQNLTPVGAIPAVIGPGGPGGAYGTSDYANTIVPDIVASVAVEQAWGQFKASFAAHDNHAGYFGGTELSGHPDDVWGWAGQLGLSYNLPWIAPGDVINISGVYTDGATRYNIQDLTQAGAAAMYSGTGLLGAYQSFGFGNAPDTLFAVGVSQQKVQTWGFRGGYTHNWNPFWNTSIYGAWASVHYNDSSTAMLCGGVVNGIVFAGSVRTAFNPVGSGTAITSCDPNYQVWQAGIITRWTPVKNLTFSADVTWQRLDQNYVGTVSAPAVALAKPAAVYEIKDQSNVVMLLRAQRNW